MSPRFQRLASLALAVSIALSPSTFAENRSRGRTDLEKLAEELERALGKGSVRVERRQSAPLRDSASRSLPSEQAILAAMNRERNARGLGALRHNDKLSRAAGDRIGDMFAKNYFAHVSPDGVEPFVWASKRGYRYRLIGENLAVGYRGTAVVDGWMRSPGHRENILQPSFDEVGIAIADGSPRRGYRGPTVVAMYGAR